METPFFCPLCQQAMRLLTHPVFGDFGRCDPCFYAAKAPKDCLDEDACKRCYDQHENFLDDPVYRGWFKRYIAQAIQPFLPDPLPKDFKILDFASGPEPVLASVLEERFQVKVAIYDLHYAPDPSPLDDCYDLICATEVLEHLADPHAFFAGMKKRLKPQGILSLMTLLAPKEDQEFLAWHYLRDRTHRSFFSLSALDAFAAHYGLQRIFSDRKRLHSFLGR